MKHLIVFWEGLCTARFYAQDLIVRNLSLRSSILRLVIFMMTCTILYGCSKDDETFVELPVNPLTNFTYPIAEWQKAKVVLVHEPGNELSQAYGRNKAFDVTKMREEWVSLTNVLKQNGVQVFEVTDVLMKLPINQIRDVAQKMSYGRLDNLNKEQLIRYIIETPPMKALYYTRDQSIITPRGAIIGKMNLSHRQFEPDLIELCYHYLGGEIFYRLHEEGARLEGGDYFPFGTLSIIGEGQRTNRKAIEELLTADAFGHDTVVVVKDALRNTYQMHLDTYFNILDHNLVILSQERLNAKNGDKHYLSADIFARSPESKEYQLYKGNVNFVEFLKDRNVHIIPVIGSDLDKLATNFLCLSPRHVIGREGLSESFKKNMEDNSVKVDYLKLDELAEGDGLVHCMTQVIGRN